MVILLYTLLKNKVSILISILIINSLFIAYLFGPIRQSLANVLLLLALFSVNKYLIGLMAISVHWSAIVPSSIALFFNIKNKYYKYIIYALIIIFIYIFYVDNPWFDLRAAAFLNDQPYFALTSILFKFITCAVFVYAVHSKVLNNFEALRQTDNAALAGLSLSFFCQFLGFFSLGENAIQRLGMMFDVFALYSFIRIFSKQNQRQNKLFFCKVVLILILALKAFSQYSYLLNLLQAA